jgi:hypothetical protein
MLFFGIQYSFGLQQSAAKSIYDFCMQALMKSYIKPGTINRFVDSTYN